MSPPEWLTHFPALAPLAAELGPLLAQAQRVRLPAGQRLFEHGSDCPNFLLVIDGAVRVQRLSEGGREIVLYRVEAGQSCILTTACLLGAGRYHAEAISESAVDAVVLPRDAFLQAVGASAHFRAWVFHAYGERLSGLMALIDAVAFGRMDQRLAQLLLQRADSGALQATHQGLARELGSAREVVSRLLKEFERKGWVELGRGTLRVTDASALRTLSDAR